MTSAADLILGGHDHVYEDLVVNGRHILKSGTDFRQFSVLSLDLATSPPAVTVQPVAVTRHRTSVSLPVITYFGSILFNANIHPNFIWDRMSHLNT